MKIPRKYTIANENLFEKPGKSMKYKGFPFEAFQKLPFHFLSIRIQIITY